MTRFEKINKNIEKIRATKAQEVEKFKKKLEAAKTALNAATEAKTEAYNADNETAYTKARRDEDEAAALVDMYSKKLAGANAIQLDFSEAVKSVHSESNSMISDAKLEIRKKFDDINKIIDSLYAELSAEQMFLQKYIGACEDTRLLDINTTIPFIRAWNVDIRSKETYGILTAQHRSNCPIDPAQVVWTPDK